MLFNIFRDMTEIFWLEILSSPSLMFHSGVVNKF